MRSLASTIAFLSPYYEPIILFLTSPEMNAVATALIVIDATIRIIKYIRHLLLRK